MVLTGKQSLDFSGGVSAEDNFGIGGYDRVMGPNGQAQYWAKDLVDAYGILLAHYENTWVAPGEAGPRRAPTNDPHDRDVTPYPHVLAGSDFTTVGDIFSPATNADRKKAFDIRTLMRAVADQDHGILERWAGMADAETAVVFDARIGGIPVCLLGIESQDGAEARGARRPTARTSTRPARSSRARRRRRPGRSTPRAATGRSSCSPTCPASTAHPTRCARCSSSTAPRSAGRSSTSTGRSSSSSSRATTVVRSSCSPRRSTRG